LNRNVRAFVSVKAVLLAALILAITAAGVVVFSQNDFEVSVRVVKAEARGADVDFVAEVTFRNNGAEAVDISYIRVDVFQEDRVTPVLRQIVISGVHVPAGASRTVTVPGTILNVDAIGMTVYVVLEVAYTQGGNTVQFRHEGAYSIEGAVDGA
jgi:hypothetical protein